MGHDGWSGTGGGRGQPNHPWMMRLPRGESLGGVSGEPEPDSLGLGFPIVDGVGKVVLDILGLGSTTTGVSADGPVFLRGGRRSKPRVYPKPSWLVRPS
jgi:hypothetical protein